MIESIKKVLILGSSALKIGQAGEFDYSGSQAIKALKQEGVFTVLINPNIATVQTSNDLADKIYFLPVNEHFVTQVIKKERPDGILLSFGGQTSLNCGLALNKKGVFKEYDTKVLGTGIDVIESTEDRHLFIEKLNEINVKTPFGSTADTPEQAVEVAGRIGFPVMIRIAYALGGLGSGVCYNKDDVLKLTSQAFAFTRQVLIEEYLDGWKEIEYEVVRDRYENCICICNMENLDPVGIHTGESIVVAPSQTLNNHEYHFLREISIKVIQHLGIVGECNIQFALDPNRMDYRVIEVNARLSRSSALASKATGYPLALVAAKLSLGYSLAEVQNSITQVTLACFEPALDYVVVKIPKWDLKKFSKVFKQINTGMKSVGEVMAIGRTLEETLQKAIRMLEVDTNGLIGKTNIVFEDLESELKNPTDERIFAMAQALEKDMSVDKIHELTNVDKWFIYKIKKIVDVSRELSQYQGGFCPCDLLQLAKRSGFSDSQISYFLNITQEDVISLRKGYGIKPFIKQIDTLAAEYPAKTNYLYLTYNGSEDDISSQSMDNCVIVLGSGAYRIGSSVEFDWCGVNTIKELKSLGYRTIMINNNPETVSTDFDECDRLYFEELSLETIYEIYQKERPLGVIVSMGGQTPNSLALELDACGVNILGTSVSSIDMAEDRQKFSTLLDSIHIEQPVWAELSTQKEAQKFVEKIGYPVIVRPSYVLSGASMGVALNNDELEKIMKSTAIVSKKYPIVISQFIDNAKEIDIDAVAQKGDIVAFAICEHVENAGVHSGDATLVTPPQRIYIETLRQILNTAAKIAKELAINGPFNIQYIAKHNKVRVIECNLRASRSVPFVSKVTKKNMIRVATKVIMGVKVEKQTNSFFNLGYVGVKAPQFSFTRLHGADPVTGVEMASTGEVGCLGEDFQGAFLKSLISVGFKLPVKSILVSSGSIKNKIELLFSLQQLAKNNIRIYATRGTSRFLNENAVENTFLHWPNEEKEPNTISHIKEGKIDLVINIPRTNLSEELTNDYVIRRTAVDFGRNLITNVEFAKRFIETITHKNLSDLRIKSWDEFSTGTH